MERLIGIYYNNLKQKIMKEIKLTPVEFYTFRKIAFAFGIAFICNIANTTYIVKANIDELEEIGY